MDNTFFPSKTSDRHLAGFSVRSMQVGAMAINGMEGNCMVSSRVGKHRDIISEAFDFMSCRDHWEAWLRAAEDTSSHNTYK